MKLNNFKQKNLYGGCAPELPLKIRLGRNKLSLRSALAHGPLVAGFGSCAENHAKRWGRELRGRTGRPFPNHYRVHLQHGFQFLYANSTGCFQNRSHGHVTKGKLEILHRRQAGAAALPPRIHPAIRGLRPQTHALTRTLGGKAAVQGRSRGVAGRVRGWAQPLPSGCGGVDQYISMPL